MKPPLQLVPVPFKRNSKGDTTGFEMIQDGVRYWIYHNPRKKKGWVARDANDADDAFYETFDTLDEARRAVITEFSQRENLKQPDFKIKYEESKGTLTKLLKALRVTHQLVYELMDCADRMDAQLAELKETPRDCELSAITRIRGQLSRNNALLASQS